MRAGIGSAAALIFLLVAGAASARDIPSGGLTRDDVVAWLQGAGYQAQIMTPTDGRPSVRSGWGGHHFNIYMFDCNADRCGSMQFSAGFALQGKFDTSRMNEWNRDSRWARGFFDSTNDPWVQYDIDLTPGGTYELLNDQLLTWHTMLDRFVKLYGL
jgi:Putative bacterial sensory transduction regulator